MPHSAAESAENSVAPGQRLAVAAETLYLVNLMLAPVLGFVVLAVLWWRYRHSAPALARNHLRQTFTVSVWGGALISLVCLALILIFGIESGWTWTWVVIYFTCVHSTLILLGVMGLTKAMAGKHYVYPLIGPRDDAQ